MNTNYYGTNANLNQESWVEVYEAKLKVVREKIYAYLNEPYKDTFDVAENIVRLSSDAQGLNLALDYSRLESEMEKQHNAQRDDISRQSLEKQSINEDGLGSRSGDVQEVTVSKKDKDLCEDFKVESLPSVMRRYVEDICKTTEAHPIMVASSVLTMMSGFLGTRVLVPEGAYYQDLYPNLWMLNITKSGSFKSSALSKGSKIAYDYSKEVSLKVKQYYEEIKLETDPKRKQELHNEMVKVSRRNPILPNKITPEALLSLLDQGHGGTIMSNEFGGWLANLENSQSGDLKALFTELYDGHPYRYYTKSQGDFIIEKPCFSINGVSNLPWIKEKIKPTDVESGFFARFLLYTPKYSVNAPEYIPECFGSNDTADGSGLKRILKEVRLRHDRAGDIKLRLNDEAKEFGKQMHKDMYKMVWEDKPSLKDRLTPYLKRWSPYTIKLGIIFQMIIDPQSTHIGLEAMKAAKSMLWPAICSTIDLFENHLGMSDHQDKCLKLYRFIDNKFSVNEQPLTRQAICASEVLTGGSKEYTEVLTTLVDEGKLIFRQGVSINTGTYRPNGPTRENMFPDEPSPVINKPVKMHKKEEYSAESIERDYKMLSSLKNLKNENTSEPSSDNGIYNNE